MLKSTEILRADSVYLAFNINRLAETVATETALIEARRSDPELELTQHNREKQFSIFSPMFPGGAPSRCPNLETISMKFD